MQNSRNKSFTSVFSLNQKSQNQQKHEDIPLLCYICGFQDRPDLRLQMSPQKQKICLSKMNKFQKNLFQKTSTSQLLKNQILSTQRKQISFISQIKIKSFQQNSTIKQPLIQPKFIQKIHSRPIIQAQYQNRLDYSKYKNEQPKQNSNVRFSYSDRNMNQQVSQKNDSYNLFQRNSHHYKDMPHLNKPQFFNTEPCQFIYSQTHIKQNPSLNSYHSQKFQNNQSRINNSSQFHDNYKDLNKIIKQCASKQYIKIDYSKQELESKKMCLANPIPKNNQSTPSTQEQIPPSFINFKDSTSFQEPLQLKMAHNKKKSSRSNKVPKFLSNLKKASSKNQNQVSVKSLKLENNESNISHLGKKYKIKVRKVQSYDSSSSDQFSEVISQGGRSFLMPQINQVQQMSRISSRSNFKNWQDDPEQI